MNHGATLPEKPAPAFTLEAPSPSGREPPSDVPQSWKTFTEPVTFRNPISQKLPATFVFFLDQDQNPEVVIPGNDDSSFAMPRGKASRRAAGRSTSSRAITSPRGLVPWSWPHSWTPCLDNPDRRAIALPCAILVFTSR